MNIKRWIPKLVIFILLTSVILFGTLKFLMVPDARDTVGLYGFRLEPENSLDVVLIGPSFLYRSFYSPLAYELEGFTSYNFSVNKLPAVMYKTALDEVLATQDPDLIVFDVRGFAYQNQHNEATLHRFLDALPFFSIQRLKAIKNIVPRNQLLYYLNPFMGYHGEGIDYASNWDVLMDKLTMRRTGYSITKNFSSRTNIVENTGDANLQLTDANVEIASALVDYLHEKGIEQALFLRTPIPVPYNINDNYYKMVEVFEDAGYEFLDLHEMQDEIGLDYYTDWDSTGHVNVYGCEKFTHYLSRYIMEHYTINTEHSDKVTEEWEYCMSFTDSIFNELKELCQANEARMHYLQKDFPLE